MNFCNFISSCPRARQYYLPFPRAKVFHAFIQALVLRIFVLTILLIAEEITYPANDGHDGDIIPVLQVLTNA